MSNTYRTPPHPFLNVNADNVDALILKHQDKLLDEALMESFPASDPIAISFTCVIKHDISLDINKVGEHAKPEEDKQPV